MSVAEFFSSPFCMRLALGLLHFLWQGCVLAVLAALIAASFGKRSSNIRYWAYLGCLFAMVTSLVLTCVWVEIPASSFNRVAAAGFGVNEPVPPPSPVLLDSQPKPTIETVAASASVPKEPEASPAAPTAPVSRGFTFDWQPYAPYAVGFYLLGVAAVFSRFLIGYGGGQRLRRRSQPVEDPAILSALARQARKVGLAITPAIAYCGQIAVPTVVGLFKPTILLPFSFATGLTPEQVELLLCHELAHIRRLDPLFNVLQRVIEAILFFHPAMWFISHRARVERENCCDDIVLAAGGDSAEYVSSLVEVAKKGLNRSVPSEGLAVAGRPSQLRGRILRMLGNRDHEQMRLKQVWFPALVVLASLSAFVSLASDKTPANGSGFITGTVESKESGEPLENTLIRVAVTEAAPRVLGVALSPKEKVDMRDHRGKSDLTILETRTDKEGNYRTEIPIENSSVQVSLDALLPGYRTSAGSFMAGGDFDKHGQLFDGKEMRFDFELEDALYLKGQVVDDNANPIAGVTVSGALRMETGEGGIATTTTDESGAFELLDYPLPTNPRMEIYGPNSRGIIRFVDSRYTPTQIENVYDWSEEKRTSLKVVMNSGFNVSGVVIDSKGQPISDTMVEACLGGAPEFGLCDERKTDRTDESGAFSVQGVSPGQLTLMVHAMSKSEKGSVSIDLNQDSDDVVIQLKPVKLKNPPQVFEILGMKLVDMNSELKSLYDFFQSRGAVILDPGSDHERLGIGELCEGYAFIMAGNKQIANIQEFVDEVLRIQSKPPEPGFVDEGHKGKVRVVYAFRNETSVGTNTQYMKMTEEDEKELHRFVQAGYPASDPPEVEKPAGSESAPENTDEAKEADTRSSTDPSSFLDREIAEWSEWREEHLSRKDDPPASVLKAVKEGLPLDGSLVMPRESDGSPIEESSRWTALYYELAEKPCSIVGTVVDQYGKPIPGAVIAGLLSFHVGDHHGGGAKAKPVETNEDGRFAIEEIPEGPYHFRAFAEGYLGARTVRPIVVNHTNVRGTADFTLQWGNKVAGSVVAPDGQPVEGVRVEVNAHHYTENSSDFWCDHDRMNDTTDAEGRFEIEVEEKGTYSLLLKHDNFARRIAYALPPGEESPPIQLAAGGKLSGRIVTEKEGRKIPAAGVWVTAKSKDRGAYSSVGRHETETDENGRFVFPHLRRVQKQWGPPDEGWEPRSWVISCKGFERVISFTESDAVEDLEMVVRESEEWTVRGRVTNAETGEPIKVFTLDNAGGDWDPFFTPEWEGEQQLSDDGGAFEVVFDSIRPTQRIRIRVEGYKPALSERMDGIDGDRQIEITLEAGGNLPARVVDSDGNPVADASVILLRPEQNVTVRNGRVHTMDLPTILSTDAEGKLAIPEETERFTLLVLHDRGFARIRSASLEGSEEISLISWGKVRGVAMKGEEPWPDQKIELDGGWNPLTSEEGGPYTWFLHTTETDAEGRFEFDRVIPNTYSMGRPIEIYRFGHLGGQALGHTKRFTLSEAEDLDVSIGGLGTTIRGTVALDRQLDPRVDLGQGYIDMRLKKGLLQEIMGGDFGNETTRRYVARLESDGSFQIDSVAPGAYEMVVKIMDERAIEMGGHQPLVAEIKKQAVEIPGGDAPHDLGEIVVPLLSSFSAGTGVK